MAFDNVGKVWTPEEFPGYLETVDPPTWAQAITLHHTGVPSLDQRPDGFTPTHMQSMQHYYQNVEVHDDAGNLLKGKWDEGPHLFIDDDQCWGMTDLNTYGVHAGSFNRSSIGIEVLGNYNVESPFSGRGRKCWDVTFAIARALLDWLGLPVDSSSVLFHRDDPYTTKLCPGDKVTKTWVIEQIIMQRAGQFLPPTPPRHRWSATPW